MWILVKWLRQKYVVSNILQKFYVEDYIRWYLYYVERLDLYTTVINSVGREEKVM